MAGLFFKDNFPPTTNDAVLAKPWDDGSLRTFTGGTDSSVYSVAFAPDGRSALSGGDESNLILWDVETGKQGDLQTPTKVYSVAFAPDELAALSGIKATWWGEDEGENLILLDAATGSKIRSFKGHSGDVYLVALAPDGRRDRGSCVPRARIDQSRAHPMSLAGH